MKIKNNLFERMETVKDGKYYAVNINLKSGEVIHLERLERSEKDAYVNYVRNGHEKMLIETNKSIWRILPDDIEKVEVKAYGTQQADSVYPLVRLFMAKSRIQTHTFTRFITFFILLLLGVIIFSGVKGMVKEGPVEILFDPALAKPYLLSAKQLFSKGGWILLIIMLILNIFDFISKSTQTYYILDEDRGTFEGTKILHLLVTVSCFIGFIIVNSVVFKLLDVFL